VLTVGTIAAAALVAGAPAALASVQAPVGLGTAAPFGVLAGQSVTNTGPSVITRDLGVSPGTAITGFPPGVVTGAEHSADAVALQAQNDLTTAYLDAASRAPDAVTSVLTGQTLAPGVYKANAGMSLTGTVTLDGQGRPDAVFIFQAGSTLITGSSSTVNLINGAQACNVFWQVGSSATLGTNNTFVGTVMALTSATVQTGTSVAGRVLARNGSVTLDNNRITRPTCTTPPIVPPITVPPITVPPILGLPPISLPPITLPPIGLPGGGEGGGDNGGGDNGGGDNGGGDNGGGDNGGGDNGGGDNGGGENP
jgi:uncharacterized membrane protein YgcG